MARLVLQLDGIPHRVWVGHAGDHDTVRRCEKVRDKGGDMGRSHTWVRHVKDHDRLAAQHGRHHVLALGAALLVGVDEAHLRGVRLEGMLNNRLTSLVR